MLIETDTHRPDVELMLPLINVILLLLIFFLVVGNTVNPLNKEIKVPQTQQAQKLPKQIPINWLYLNAHGKLFYKRQPLSPDELKNQALPDKVILFADATTAGKWLTQTLKALPTHKIKQLSLVVETQ